MTLLVGALAVVIAALVAALAYRSRPPQQLRAPRDARRILVPFANGGLDPTVLSAAIRIARAENAVLVPAYLLIVPLEFSMDSPLTKEVTIAVPVLEAVEHAALRCGVPVDARIEKGRTRTHALERLWEGEPFDRIVVPAPVQTGRGFSSGFTLKDVSWILSHAPTETVVLKPSPAPIDTPEKRGPTRRWTRTLAQN
jgi:hypothetical protein